MEIRNQRLMKYCKDIIVGWHYLIYAEICQPFIFRMPQGKLAVLYPNAVCQVWLSMSTN